jgi:hypothetical protein
MRQDLDSKGLLGYLGPVFGIVNRNYLLIPHLLQTPEHQVLSGADLQYKTFFINAEAPGRLPHPARTPCTGLPFLNLGGKPGIFLIGRIPSIRIIFADPFPGRPVNIADVPAIRATADADSLSAGIADQNGYRPQPSPVAWTIGLLYQTEIGYHLQHPVVTRGKKIIDFETVKIGVYHTSKNLFCATRGIFSKISTIRLDVFGL